jgi:hypothetical protein
MFRLHMYFSVSLGVKNDRQGLDYNPIIVCRFSIFLFLFTFSN